MQGCHPAYAFASAVTGVINLLYLLVAALLSLSSSPRRVLCFSSLIGALAFTLLGRDALPGLHGKLGGDDPRNAGTWLAAVGIGFSAMCSTVCSLALVSRARAELLHAGSGPMDADTQSDASHSSFSSLGNSEGVVWEAEVGAELTGNAGSAAAKEEIAGALAGAYSFCSGASPPLFPSTRGARAASHAESLATLISPSDLYRSRHSRRLWCRWGAG